MTTTGLPRKAADGHRWVWRRTDIAEPGHTWEVLTADEIGRPCRFGRRPGHEGCGAQAVARVNLAGAGQWPQWAYFCQEHLYRRRIIDGVLHTEVQEPIPGGEAA